MIVLMYSITYIYKCISRDGGCNLRTLVVGIQKLAAGKRTYPAKIRPSTAMLIRGVILIVDIDRNLSKIKEKTHRS